MPQIKSTLSNLDWEDFEQTYKKLSPETITVNEDLIVLSCCLHRLRNRFFIDLNSYLSLQDITLANHVTNEDVILSNEIKNYYNKKLLFKALINQSVTKYRTDLLQLIQTREPLIHMQPRKYEKKFLGMAWTLPDFYKYDIELDQLFETVGCSKNNLEKVDIKLQLKHLKTLSKTIKKISNLEFWFHNVKHNIVVKIPIEKTNPLLPTFDKLYQSDNFAIEGNWVQTTMDNHTFYTPRKWAVVFD